ncbi:MAG: hypothetical protein N3E47_06990 [Candidatus Bathyarchaeota archaeon]|nr:hypothetical protein [Candidatus Bathyarchaeota archaeon]
MEYVQFYAMDAAPAMLISLRKKSGKITPFVGKAEDKGARTRASSPAAALMTC